MKIGERITRVGYRLVRIPESPHDIAKAFAVGMFIGFAPFMGLLVALLVAWRLGLSKLAVSLGALTNNPWTTPFIYGAGYRIGVWILDPAVPIDWSRIVTLRDFSFREAIRLGPPVILGSFVLAAASAAVSYVVVRGLVGRYKLYRVRRRERRRPIRVKQSKNLTMG